MTPTLVFDIETIPDIAGLRVLHELPASLGDAEVAELTPSFTSVQWLKVTSAGPPQKRINVSCCPPSQATFSKVIGQGMSTYITRRLPL